ncbi:MAG: amidohydrolase family protein [bacterium]
MISQYRKATFCVVFVCALLWQALSFAQVLIVKAERMLNVEAGKVISPAMLVIEGEYIKAVNPESLPGGAKTLDLGDVTLLPGLIDMHTHLIFQLSANSQLKTVTESTADWTINGMVNARKTLLAGFTTVRDVAARDFIAVALAKASAAGTIAAPRIIPAGHALSITGGHGDAGGFAPGILEGGPEQGIADGVDEVVKAVRYQIKHGAKVIKIAATAGVLSFEGPVGAQQYSEPEIRAIVEEAARHGIKVAAHAHGTEGIKAAVRAGVASIEHGSMLDDEAIALMKQNGTYLVPTTYLAEAIDLKVLPPIMRAKAERVIPLAQRSLEKAIRAGVKIAFGTDAAVFPHGLNGKEFGALVDRGMKPIEAIRAATINATDLLGMADRGVLKAGLLADIVAVQENPLEDIRVLENVQFVMKGGRVYKRSESKK